MRLETDSTAAVPGIPGVPMVPGVPGRILVVDDDPIVADSLAEFLMQDGHEAATAGSASEAMAMLEATNGRGRQVEPPPTAPQRPFGLMISDMNMPGSDGLSLLRQARKRYDCLSTIAITGYGKIEDAVEAIKLGAVDYLTKPIVDDELRVAVGKAMQQHALLAENQSLRSQLTERFGIGNILGSDYRMQKVYDLIQAVSESRTTVLIEGESGTGKSMVAQAIHTRSDRRTGPLVTFACGAIPETLLESELFGHVRGAFTGADNDKPGKIMAAHGGTLFIDEINSATPALQLKLLRVLQEKQFEPVGSTQTVHVDVRFVLATNEPLEQLVAQNRLRRDLYYRINVVNIKLPTLSQRSGDVPLLAAHFLEKYCRESGKTITGFTIEAMDALRRYAWPGNVRELENAVERAVVLCRRPVIEFADLPETLRELPDHGNRGPAGDRFALPTDGNWTPMPLRIALEEPERQIIAAALQANDWNRQETARQLDINRSTLYKKIRQYRLDEPA